MAFVGDNFCIPILLDTMIHIPSRHLVLLLLLFAATSIAFRLVIGCTAVVFISDGAVCIGIGFDDNDDVFDEEREVQVGLPHMSVAATTTPTNCC